MFLKNIIYGLFIGLGFIIPGVSGGVLATIIGIYDKIIGSLINFKDNIKDNFLFIMPIFIGIIISIFLFSKIILYLINYKYIFISYVFIGLILGCIPFLLKEIKLKTQQYIAFIPFMISFIIGIGLFILEQRLPINNHNPNGGILFIAGSIYAVGKIVPGISGAALLMLLGVYEYFLNIIANPLLINLKLIISFIPFIISFIISAIILLKVINYLLLNYFRYTYSAIIGFIISSILFIYPHSINRASLVK